MTYLTVQDALLDQLLRGGSGRELLIQLVLLTVVSEIWELRGSPGDSLLAWTSPARPSCQPGCLRARLTSGPWSAQNEIRDVSSVELQRGSPGYLLRHEVIEHEEGRYKDPHFHFPSQTDNSPLRIPFSCRSLESGLLWNNFSSFALSAALSGSRSWLLSTPPTGTPGAGTILGARV